MKKINALTFQNTIQWRIIVLILLSFARSAYSQDKPVLIKNATVLSCQDETIKKTKQDVLISGGKITAVSKKIKGKKGYVVIEGKGKFLIPGLADMHAHLPSPGNAINMEQYLTLQILAGVTYVRSMRGAEDHLQWREKIRNHSTIGPELYLSPSPIASNTTVSSEDLDALLKKYKEQGFDFVKLLSLPNKNQFYERLVAASLAHGLPIAGHIPNGNLGLALQNNQQTIEHLQGYTGAIPEETLLELIRQTKDRGIYNCPTLDWTFVGSSSQYYSLQNLKNRPGLQYLTEALKNQWEQTLVNYLKNVKPDEIEKDRNDLESHFNVLRKMRAAKCLMLLSPDASSVFQVPGFGLVEEMKLFARAGYTAEEIFRIATINPAMLMKREKEMGKIETGYNANLVLLDGNPLDNLDNYQKINGVMIKGKWHAITDILTSPNNK